MTYTVIYFEKDGKRTWKKTGDIETAEDFGRQNSDGNRDFDILVPLYEYDRLKSRVERMEQRFEQIKDICEGV